MASDLSGTKIAVLVAPAGVEQVELEQPWRALRDAGAEPELISLEPGQVQAFNGDVNAADKFDVDRTIADATKQDYAGLVLPGGTTNPDKLRLNAEAMDFVRGFARAGKPIAAICHGPWSLVEAGVLPGKTLTSWPSLATDIRNAGGTWVDKEVFSCTDEGWTLVSSRKPDDLPAFCTAMLEAFSRLER